MKGINSWGKTWKEQTVGEEKQSEEVQTMKQNIVINIEKVNLENRINSNKT